MCRTAARAIGNVETQPVRRFVLAWPSGWVIDIDSDRVRRRGIEAQVELRALPARADRLPKEGDENRPHGADGDKPLADGLPACLLETEHCQLILWPAISPTRSGWWRAFAPPERVRAYVTA